MELTRLPLSLMPDDAPTTTHTSAEIDLRRLAVLRTIVVAAQIVVVVAAAALDVSLLFIPVTAVIALSAGLVVFTFWRLRHRRPVSDAELLAQLLIDVAALTTLPYLTGGSTNPFVVLYILPLSMTAAALPGIYAWAAAGVSAACYTALLWFYIPLPYLEAHAERGTADADEIVAALQRGDTGNTNVAVAARPLSVDRLEWEHIQKVLQECAGNVSETARRLGMHRRTLQRKLTKRPAR